MDCAEALGLVIDGKRRETRPSSKRVTRLACAVKALLRRRRCTGAILEVITGHATFLGLMLRPCLASFNAPYKFIRRH